MNVKNLESLATLLEKLPPDAEKKFDMDVWLQTPYDTFDDWLQAGRQIEDSEREDYPCQADYEVDSEKVMWKCGTAGCAMGWATVLPEFQAAGFKLVMTLDTACRTVDDVFVMKDGSDESYDFLEVATDLFDLDTERAMYLFSGEYMYEDDNGEYSEQVPPARVAARIRTLIKYPDIYLDPKGRRY